MSTDIADLRRKQLASREFTVTVGAASYTLRLPTQHEKQVQAMRARGTEPDADAAMSALLLRLLLERAVVGWSGVVASQLVPGAGADVVDFAPDAVPLLLDGDPDTALALTDAFVRRENERNNRVDAAAKN